MQKKYIIIVKKMKPIIGKMIRNIRYVWGPSLVLGIGVEVEVNTELELELGGDVGVDVEVEVEGEVKLEIKVSLAARRLTGTANA